MFPLVVILRGISGVGKTVLRKLLKVALEALDKKVKVISKDDYRRHHMPWLYTKEQELELANWYDSEYGRSLTNNYDFIISDTTMCRGSEITIPFKAENLINTGKIVVINLGNADSITNSKIGDEHVARQREVMQKTQYLLDRYETKGYCTQYHMDARSSVEEGISDIVKELVLE